MAEEVKVKIKTEGFEGIKDAASDVTDQFGIMDSGVGKLITGIKSFGKSGVLAMNGLKGAIAATGIGLLLIAVSSLVVYFTQTGKGAEQLKVIMAGLGAVIDILTGAIAKLGEWLISAFTDPKKALQELIDAIENNLMNRIKAFKVIFEALGDLLHGRWAKGLKGVENGFIQLGTGIENAVDKTEAFVKEMARAAEVASNLEKQTQALNKAKREDALGDVKMEQQLYKLQAIYMDVNKTKQERLDALKEEMRLKQEDAAGDVVLAQRTLDIEKAKRAELIRSGKGITEEQEKSYNDLRIALEQAKNREFQIIAESTKKLSTFEKQIDKEEEDRKKAFYDKLNGLAESNSILEAKTQEEKDQLALEYDIDKQQKELDAMVLNQEEKDQLQEELDINSELRRQQLKDKQAAEASKKQDEQDKKELDARKKQSDALLSATTDFLGAIADAYTSAAGEDKQKQIQALKIQRAAGIAKIVIASGQAIMKALADYGPIIGGVLAATITASGLLQIQKINKETQSSINDINKEKVNSQKKFGGMIMGPSHGSGGVLVNAEGGEFIMNKKASAMYGPLLNDMNMSGINGNNNIQNVQITEERIAQIAANVVSSVPVYVTEYDMTNTQRKVQVREKGFSQK